MGLCASSLGSHQLATEGGGSHLFSSGLLKQFKGTFLGGLRAALRNTLGVTSWLQRGESYLSSYSLLKQFKGGSIGLLRSEIGALKRIKEEGDISSALLAISSKPSFNQVYLSSPGYL